MTQNPPRILVTGDISDSVVPYLVQPGLTVDALANNPDDASLPIALNQSFPPPYMIGRLVNLQQREYDAIVISHNMGAGIQIAAFIPKFMRPVSIAVSGFGFQDNEIRMYKQMHINNFCYRPEIITVLRNLLGYSQQ